MKTMRQPITTLTIATTLFALLVSILPAQPGRGEGRAHERMGQNTGPMPIELSTNPDGQFAHFMERLHEEMVALGEKRQAIAESGAQVRRLNRSNDPADAEALADHLAQMHLAAEELHEAWAESRERLSAEMLPLLPEIIAEIDQEISVTAGDSPSAAMLQRIREGLVRWQEDPDVMPMFDRMQDRQTRFMERVREDSEGSAHWLVQRLERLERRQMELVDELDRLERQINGVREMVDGLPPEELEALEEPPMRERGGPEGRGRRGRF